MKRTVSGCVWTLLAALLLSVGSAGRASAEGKTYHGSSCRPAAMPLQDGPVDYFEADPPMQDGSPRGYTSLGGYLDCPIIRDVTGNDNGLQDFEVEIAAGADSAGTAECILSSIAYDGSAVLAMATRATSAGATLDFGDSVNASDALGYYHLFCRLPPNWTLVRYTAEEYGAGDDGAPGAPSPRNGKSYNAASFCFPSQRTQRLPAQSEYFGYPPDGYTTRSAANCPIVRDSGSGALGLAGLELNLEGPGESSATCSVYSISADGLLLWSSTLQSDEEGATRLDFGDLSARATSSEDDGSYSLHCSFSDDKVWSIESYRVVEQFEEQPQAPPSGASGDKKTYPGSMCRPNQLDVFTANYYMSLLGYYFHLSDNPAVLCPLIRDVTNNTDGLRDIDIWVSAPGAGEVGCGLFMMTATGAILTQVAMGVAFGPAGGVQQIDFAASKAPIAGPDLSSESGSYGIACSLPKGFSIIGYMVEEHYAGISD